MFFLFNGGPKIRQDAQGEGWGGGGGVRVFTLKGRLGLGRFSAPVPGPLVLGPLGLALGFRL